MKKTGIEPYLFILPGFLIVLVVYIFPIYKAINDSLFYISGQDRIFIGLENYRFLLFEDSIFRTSLLNNLKLLLGIPIMVCLALSLAFLLYSQFKGWTVFRVVLILPYILSITAIGITFDYILRENGLLNLILETIGLASITRNWLGDASTALWAVLGVVIWKELGFGVILFLARMMSVDKQTIEAAIVDGASSIQIFFLVILPEMTNVIFFYSVINMINMLSWMFNYIFVMTRGGPVKSTYVLEYYIYQTGIRYRQYGISSSLAVITFLIAIIFVVSQGVVRKMFQREEV